MHPLIAHAQNADGGWGYLPATASSAEPTCLALLAARPGPQEADAIQRASGWLAAAQDGSGSLRLCEGDDGGGWPTSLALLAWAHHGLEPARRALASGWLLATRGAEVLSDQFHHFDDTVHGWPWYGDTFTWIEPTAYALLALKRNGLRNHPRITEAHRVLLDRACAGGGWNHIHNNSFGVRLEPLPRVTAIVLLALQDLAAEPQVRAAVDYLRGAAPRSKSALARSWGALALAAHGLPVGNLQTLLRPDLDPDAGVLRKIPATALAALALDLPDRNPFRLP